MALTKHPSLFQINTRVWLTELSLALGRPATLDDIPDADLDRLAETGFDWVWFRPPLHCHAFTMTRLS
jgi:hypothetical protein